MSTRRFELFDKPAENFDQLRELSKEFNNGIEYTNGFEVCGTMKDRALDPFWYAFEGDIFLTTVATMNLNSEGNYVVIGRTPNKMSAEAAATFLRAAENRDVENIEGPIQCGESTYEAEQAAWRARWEAQNMEDEARYRQEPNSTLGLMHAAIRQLK